MRFKTKVRKFKKHKKK